MQAQEEADRIIEMARNKAESLTEEHELITFAKERAADIETQAKKQAEDIIADADDYIVDQLGELEEQLMKTLTTVRNGLRYVRENQAKARVEELEEGVLDEEKEEEPEL